MIFEYEQLATDRAALRGWAQQWHALGTMPFGAAYNAALQQITDRFSGANKAPAKPNGSPLNQIRTNEIALSSPWELREFRIAGGQLREVPVAQSPDNSLQGTPRLAKFINDNEAAILDRNFTIPAQFEGAAFQAGSSLVPFGFFWQAPAVNNPRRATSSRSRAATAATIAKRTRPTSSTSRHGRPAPRRRCRAS